MRLTDNQTLVLLAVLITGALVVIGLCLWSLKREETQTLHSHADGTIHSHVLGARRHEHPTFVERHDARMAFLFRQDATSCRSAGSAQHLLVLRDRAALRRMRSSAQLPADA